MVEKAVFFLISAIVLIGGLALSDSEHKRQAERCQAAKQTVLEDADLITVSGKFPSEKITNRWKELLRGCEEVK